MQISRRSWDGTDARSFAATLRSVQPQSGEIAADVTAIIEQVRARGDQAVLELNARFSGFTAGSLRVPAEQLDAAVGSIPPELREALELAASNVRSVAETDRPSPTSVEPGAGQTIGLRDVPVAAAGAYVPGGLAAYPSSAVMCCVPARVAGVQRVAVASPPDAEGRVDMAVLAAAVIAGAGEVYAMGGVQAIAALALGTESVAPVDVVCGPGNRFVQEAKRQLVGTVGIDGIAGPSELMVICDAGADERRVALDLLAQAEHGPDGLMTVASADVRALDRIEMAINELIGRRPTVAAAPLELVEVPDLDTAAELADALAPEHLEILAEDAAELADSVSYAGCIFIGPGGATAFGDYMAGSNHVLPTGGAGRFTGPLGPGAFRRRQAIVSLSTKAARALAGPTATLARAEGFPVHAESAEIRANPEGKTK